MNIARVETEITRLVRGGQLNLAYETFLARRYWNRLRRHFDFRPFVQLSGWVLARLSLLQGLTWDDRDDSTDLNPSFVLFWKNPDAVGLDLLVRILWSVVARRCVPARAWAWFAHWLVFQGDYRSSALLFRALLRKTRLNRRLNGECLSLVANHLYCRLRRASSNRLHRRAHHHLVESGDRFFQMFNLGVWIRHSASQGSRECLDEILSNFDQLSPERPDERYGLRLLIYAAYVHEVSGDRELSRRFEATASVVYATSGSDLDRAIYHAIRCLILMQRSEKSAARGALRDAKLYLARYGRYSYYTQLLSVLTDSVEGLPDRGPGERESEGVQFDESEAILRLQDQFEAIGLSLYLERLSAEALLQVVAQEELLDSEGHRPLFQVRGQVSHTEFLLSFTYRARFYRLRLRSPFVPWRNPADFISTKSLLLALQAHSFMIHAQRTAHLASVAREVAHDIRSPIAALQAIRAVDDSISQESKEIVDHVVARIRDVASRVLNAERLDASSAPGRKNISEVLHLVNQVILEKRLEHQCEVALDCAVEEPEGCDSVMLEPGSFCSVLSNLINNAVEATKPGEDPRVEVRICRAEAGDLEVTIQDRGTGIRPDLVARLGRERLSAGKAEGNGIGLLTARRQLESWGGRLTITSELGRGTKVDLRLTTRCS